MRFPFKSEVFEVRLDDPADHRERDCKDDKRPYHRGYCRHTKRGVGDVVPDNDSRVVHPSLLQQDADNKEDQNEFYQFLHATTP